MRKTVIALGGNALDNGKSSIKDQIEKATETFSRLAYILNNNESVITYGNGPQVGEIFEKTSYSLSICGAMSQGFLLHVISTAYQNLIDRDVLSKPAVPILSHTVINQNVYTMKPIGAFYDHKIDDSYAMEIGKGYRKMVKSPEPVSILEKDSVTYLMSNGYIPIAVGGGGIPVEKRSNGYTEFDGVVDKDLSSALIGTLIGAEDFIIITDVKNVYLDFASKTGAINKIGYSNMLNYYNKINFEEGTIRPKILAALKFLQRGGKRVCITSIDNIKTMDTGTVIE
ncbi:MAG: carbamate kinase [Ferroplasma sp.]|uniref:amino acid kinase family protein n=1 Tax=Ferroplasma sp. TaxID=2591003 RepID=UPI002814E819|nr:carbamate kinase [Ferroplasma sp.]WMT50427.1 MAG: carbamate kinase [Ferroplasma sp.]